VMPWIDPQITRTTLFNCSHEHPASPHMRRLHVDRRLCLRPVLRHWLADH
jgi:hypothetical protein